MKQVVYSAIDGSEVVLIDTGDAIYNEQIAVRALFKSRHDETPLSAGFGIEEGYTGDRSPSAYDRTEVDTGHDPFMLIDIRPGINFR